VNAPETGFAASFEGDLLVPGFPRRFFLVIGAPLEESRRFVACPAWQTDRIAFVDDLLAVHGRIKLNKLIIKTSIIIYQPTTFSDPSERILQFDVGFTLGSTC
jgi:hypothetical protein